MNATVKIIMDCYSMRNTMWVSEGLGWNNVITWCVGIWTDHDFVQLRGGELVVLSPNYMKMTTGNIINLMNKLKEHNAAGVIFTVENEFSGSILDVLKNNSKENNIPIFRVGTEKDTILFIKEINKEICYFENNVLMEESLLTDFLFKDRKKLLCAMTRIENCNINSMGIYEIAVVKVRIDKNELYPNYKYRLLKNELVNDYPMQVISTMWEDMMVFAFEIKEEESISGEVITSLERAYHKLFGDDYSNRVRIAVGRSCKPISAIRESFDQALFTLDIFDLLETNDDSIIRNYDQVGFYRILRNAHDPKVFKQFYNEKLNSLEEYDNQNNSELIETLRVYINNNCSLINTANAMYLHKNTLRYRLQRIEELTGKDLKDLRVISDFYLCFRIRDYLGISAIID